MTQKMMADILGIGQNAYSMIENGKIALTLRNRQILESRLNINSDFLVNGTLPMILSPAHNQPCTKSKVGEVGVPYFTKSVGPHTRLPIELSESDIEYYIDLPMFNDCTFYRPIFGQSMSPRYNSGDIVACKRVNSKSNIIYGQSYLCFIINDGDIYETVQVLRKSDNSKEVALVPHNPSFDSKIVPLASIAELYLICGRIERLF